MGPYILPLSVMTSSVPVCGVVFVAPASDCSVSKIARIMVLRFCCEQRFVHWSICTQPIHTVCERAYVLLLLPGVMRYFLSFLSMKMGTAVWALIPLIVIVN